MFNSDFDKWFYTAKDEKTGLPLSTLALNGTDEQKLMALEAAFEAGTKAANKGG